MSKKTEQLPFLGIPYGLLRYNGITLNQKLLFSYILSYNSGQMQFTASNDFIKNELNIGESTITKGISKLKELGFIIDLREESDVKLTWTSTNRNLIVTPFAMKTILRNNDQRTQDKSLRDAHKQKLKDRVSDCTTSTSENTVPMPNLSSTPPTLTTPLGNLSREIPQITTYKNRDKTTIIIDDKMKYNNSDDNINSIEDSNSLTIDISTSKLTSITNNNDTNNTEENHSENSIVPLNLKEDSSIEGNNIEEDTTSIKEENTSRNNTSTQEDYSSNNEGFTSINDQSRNDDQPAENVQESNQIKQVSYDMETGFQYLTQFKLEWIPLIEAPIQFEPLESYSDYSARIVVLAALFDKFNRDDYGYQEFTEYLDLFNETDCEVNLKAFEPMYNAVKIRDRANAELFESYKFTYNYVVDSFKKKQNA
jgi:hypothetical protein